MLSFYQRLAAKLFPWRGLVKVLAGSAAVGFAAVLFWGEQTQGELWLLPLLVSFLFLLCLLVLLAFFAKLSQPQSGRIKRFFAWLWQWLLTLILTALLLLWFFLFLRALSAIIRQFW